MADDTTSPTTTSTSTETAAPDWRADLPTSIRETPIIARSHTVEAAARSIIEQDMMLQRGIFLSKEPPGTPEHTAALEAAYEKFGRPKTPEDYVLPATGREGHIYDPKTAASWQRTFFKAGLNQAQVDGIVGSFFDAVQLAEGVQAQQTALTDAQGRQQLEQAFGPSTDATLREAEAFFTEMGGFAFEGKAGDEQAWAAIMQARLPDGSYLRHSVDFMGAFAEAAYRLDITTLPAPGSSAEDRLRDRHKTLTAQRYSDQGLTPDEQDELRGLAQRLTAVQEAQRRQNGGKR